MARPSANQAAGANLAPAAFHLNGIPHQTPTGCENARMRYNAPTIPIPTFVKPYGEQL